VIGAEKLSSITDWTDRNTCVLFGDGAGAVVLENRPDVEDDFMICSELNADGNWCNILKLPAGGSRLPTSHETVEQHLHSIHMEGKETFKLAVNAMVTASTNVLTNANVAPEDIAMVIPHQANIRIIQAVAKRLEVPEERVYCNIQNTGNTSAASIVISLDDAVRSGKLKRGDLILITSFGGGLTWGAMLMRY
jgi:3-oxoacyl-[acyl-carrier-protein] synthase-3